MIHTTVIPNKQTISFDIPKDYVGKQIEVIAFAKGEGITKEQPAKKKVTFNALSIDTRGYKFNRDEANDR
jgi:hypothetical protein